MFHVPNSICFGCHTATFVPHILILPRDNRVSTGEFWNGIMHELIDRGHSYAFVYFFSYLILAQFIMLNLVVAVLLINYGASCHFSLATDV